MFLKDPGSTLDYRVDWEAVCAAGASVVASEWVVQPAHADGVQIAGQGFAAREATVRLSGGVAGMLYRVVNRVTFSDGLVDERAVSIRVEER